jgi:WD40 repeat protein/transcriptional regulator with XRE-family HTH domain
MDNNIQSFESFMEVLEELRELHGKGKKEIAIRAGISPSYITHLTSGTRTTPSEKVVHALAEALDLNEEEHVRLFKAAGYDATEAILFTSKSHVDDNRLDWGEAPHISMFHGREKEVKQFRQWIEDDHCQLIALVGIGGAGKTALVTHVAEEVLFKDFDYILWRSLQHAPYIEKILQEAIYLFSERQQKASLALENLTDDIDGQIALLIGYLQEHRCLLILDNFESVLEGKNRSGNYRIGYEKYGKLLQRIGEVKHQSCLLLTSREKPGELQRIEGKDSHVHSMLLEGVEKEDARLILEEKDLKGTDEEWEQLITLYSGNPLALKLVAESIRALFYGDIGDFLSTGEIVFGGIHQLLDEQFVRLSPLESTIMYWMAIERERVSLSELEKDLAYPVSKRELLEAVAALLRRSMIEAHEASFRLQPVIMEYVTDRFVDEVYLEIEQGKVCEGLFYRHALMKARAKDFIRDYQEKLILKPIAERLLVMHEQSGSEKKLKEILDLLRKRKIPSFPDYAAGNILNLLVYLNVDLRGCDFSNLQVRQAYLQGVLLRDVNFTGADLSESIFTDTFGSIFAVALSNDGKLLAAGTANGEIRLWDTTTASPRTSLQGHAEWVRSVAFSPDGTMIASGSEDQTVRLWNVLTGQCFRILQGHTSRIYSVAYSPDGKKVVSGSDDKTIRIWDVETGTCLNALQGHEERIYSVAFHPNGDLIASGSMDETVRLWLTCTGECLEILSGHRSRVRSVTFSADGSMLASGSGDQTVRLWDTVTHECFKILEGHADCIWSVAFSPDGQSIASGSDDQTIRIWDLPSGQCRRILQRYENDDLYGNTAYSVAFSADGAIIASGCDGQIVRLWDARNGECLKTLRGHGSRVNAVAFSPDGQTIAGGYEDKMVRLWNAQDRRLSEPYRTLHAHDHWVWSIAFSPDGSMFVSGSEDKTVRLWRTDTCENLNTFVGHDNRVFSVAISPNGENLIASSSGDSTIKLWQAGSETYIRPFLGHISRVYSVAFNQSGTMLVSGSDDQTIKLWDVSSGTCFRTFKDWSSRVRSVVFSPDEQTIAEGSEDDTIKIWSVLTGECQMILCGHEGWVRSVAFSRDGKIIASGSEDGTIRLWNPVTGTCEHSVKGEGGPIYSVAFHPNEPVIAAGCLDGTIRLWDWQAGQIIHILRSDRPYERLKITGIKLDPGQKAILKALGAIGD